MKILHIAPDRDAALVAARHVHGIAQSVTLEWVQTPAAALQWLQGNRDTAAVIVEVQAQSCASFVEQLRGLGLTTPVVVVAGSARLDLSLGALNSGADGYVVAGPSLDADLPRTVAAAIERERSRASELATAAARLADVQVRHAASLARETRICLALQQRLFELESALGKADERRASEAVSFADQLAKRHAEFTASLAQAARSRDALTAELSGAMGALDAARQSRRAEAATAAEHLRRREMDLGAKLAEAVAGRAALDIALAEAEAAHQETRQRAAIDVAAATEHQAMLENLLAQEIDRRTSLDRKLTAAQTAHQESERRHTAELTSAAAGLADLQARHDAALAENATAREAFERQAAEAASALERVSRERRADAAAAAGQIASIEAEIGARMADAADARIALERTLTEAHSAQQQAAEDLAAAAARQVALEDRLAQETDKVLSLERQLSAADTARQEAQQRHTAELVELQACHDAARAANAADRAAFEQQTAEAASVLERVSRERIADAAAAAEQIASIEAALGARLTEAAAARIALERTLTEAHSAQQQAVEDLAAAAARQVELDDRLAQETDRALGLERQLSAADTARQDGDRQHASALATAAAQLASLQTQYDTALTEHAAAQAASEQSLADAATKRQQAEDRTAAALAAASTREAELVERLTKESDARHCAERRHVSELAAAAAQLASLQTQYGSALTEHAVTQAASEQRLTAAATAYQQAEDRTAAAVAAASAREAELVGQLTREAAARVALERDLTGARMESARRRDRSLYVVSTHRRRGREQKARFEEQLTGERTAADRELRAQDEEIRRLQDELQHLHSTGEEERQAHERARLTSESELHRVSAECGQIRQSFDRLQSAFQTLEQIAGDHAAERVRLEAVVADRDRQLSAESERHRVVEQDAQDALAALRETLRQSVDAAGVEMARLQGESDAVRRELDATRTHAETLRGVAERVPDLKTQLERSQNEGRRQFERAPYALCRCSPSGAITDANHSFVTLLGCRRVDEVRNTDFVAAALDSAGDLGWLLERARTTRKTETVETHWQTREGRRLVVRLQALATTTGSIDIVAEDITGVRTLEERLRQAQRMEAVGRLASEVAITCDALLGDVALGAHEWLARVGSDDALRRHAERVLTDVTRASNFLRQLGMYGSEQERALEPVSAQRVLRDLAPVLQRLVGDQIALVLPKSAGSFDVDVDTERLERVLINVAGYARERMPSGGQVRIDLATTAVGRRFVARYSNVRPGNHVLITVTELPAVGEFRGDSDASSPAANKPGVDLGVLVDLIASCGGHLWLEAQPAGNMVVKIHLPKPPAANATDNTGARASKWFRSTSAANVRA